MVKEWRLSNIVGIETLSTNKVTNAFDDTLTVSYKVGGKWKYHEFDCTTDPGNALGRNILKASEALLKPGQYRGSHKIGLHQENMKLLDR